MIEKEEIYLKNFRTGVTFYIFSDLIYNNVPENPIEYSGPFPSYVLYDNLNVASSLNTFDGQNIWSRNGDNNYVPLSSVTSNFYLTGYSVVSQIDSNLTNDQITDRVNKINTNLSDPAKFFAASAATNFVFYKKELIDDFYVDLKIQRSYNSLDTLKIYNNLVNSFPTQEAKTGVVFGRLMAIQKLKNENGKNLRIPLKNVPVGIFNPSEQFPQLFSVDENGDRISLNLKESSVFNEYFDQVSYDEDYNNYLKSAESFSAVPAQYKYITKTDDNGEFILYDIPIGEQTAIFEVDLFKQGLTKDEIAINFFPFPSNEEPNIDTVPSFVYKQFPISVVPSWGLSQTGYTSLDINVNLDLRKWSTYILPPVSYQAEKLEVSTARNITRTLKVELRDMTSANFTRNPIEVVQIVNDLDRDIGASYLWFSELGQRRNKIEYNSFGCNIFKLPANIYDPNGYRTDKDGNPTNNKGVWLSAYQLKIYIDKTSSQRTTGSHSYFTNGRFYIRNHFDLNYIDDNTLPTSTENAPVQLGVFPYEKPWSATYPEPYSIPKKPTRIIEQKTLYPTSTAQNPIYYFEEPSYYDGDLLGNEVDSIAGGFGIQATDSLWLANRISNVVTKNYMYKYEKNVSPTESYANGYEPIWNQSNNPLGNIKYPFAGISNVEGGEKYQRVECGYGYFIKPQGWSRVGKIIWGDDVPFDVANLTFGNTSTPSIKAAGIYNNYIYPYYTHRNTYLTMFNLENQNLTLALNYNSSIKEGSLDLYRVVESGLNNLSPISNVILPTGVRLWFKEDNNRLNYVHITNTGEITVKMKNEFNGPVRIDGPGGNRTIPRNDPFDFEVGDTIYGIENYPTVQQLVRYTAIRLPGNSGFNTTTNKFETASYSLLFSVIGPITSDSTGNLYPGGGYLTYNLSLGANSVEVNYYVTSSATGNGATNQDGVRTTDSSYAMYSIYIDP